MSDQLGLKLKDREKRNASARAWYAKRKSDPAFRERVQSNELTRKYGISFADKAKMFEGQSGKCAVCGDDLVLGWYSPKNRHSACVDHDHKTGKVRGLLCGHCNKALGFLCEDPERVAALERYIDFHGRPTDG